MSLRYHVVRITGKGYTRLSSHAARETAVVTTLATSLRTGPVVLRDGNTGKRFSFAELSA